MSRRRESCRALAMARPRHRKRSTVLLPRASLGCRGAGNRPCGACTYESGAQLSPTADCAGSPALAAAFLSSFFAEEATGVMPAHVCYPSAHVPAAKPQSMIEHSKLQGRRCMLLS